MKLVNAEEIIAQAENDIKKANVAVRGCGKSHETLVKMIMAAGAIEYLNNAKEDINNNSHGYWINTTDTIGFPRYQCSVCTSQQGMPYMNYCPSCGARMDALTLGTKMCECYIEREGRCSGTKEFDFVYCCGDKKRCIYNEERTK